jgi:outer membrane protein OmpA-like peptidoglycan-associated protein
MTSSGARPAGRAAPDSTDGTAPGAALGWLYLGALLAAFIALALWAYSRPDESSTLIDASASTTTTTATPAGRPAEITLIVDGAVATLTGAVPDEGARDQLVRIAEEEFGRGNVIDELTIDSRADLISGSISVSGNAATGDDSPAIVQLTVGADLGLAAGPFDIQYVTPTIDPATIVMAVAGDSAVVTGTVPDEATITRLQLSAQAVYGEGNADITGLAITPSTLDGGSITITGLTAPGDLRARRLAEVVTLDFTSSVVTDDSRIDVSDEALTAYENSIRVTLEAEPIMFDVGTSRLTDVGLNNLVMIAGSIKAVPNLGVEIVGHTDNTGGDTVNQTLSESRAEAVREALIDLGIDGTRLSTRGAGASEPIASNNTREGRERNRRIEFLFERT